jgi:hypothetical protein
MTYVAGVASSANYVVYLAIMYGGRLFGKTKLPPKL